MRCVQLIFLRIVSWQTLTSGFVDRRRSFFLLQLTFSRPLTCVSLSLPFLSFFIALNVAMSVPHIALRRAPWRALSSLTSSSPNPRSAGSLSSLPACGSTIPDHGSHAASRRSLLNNQWMPQRNFSCQSPLRQSLQSSGMLTHLFLCQMSDIHVLLLSQFPCLGSSYLRRGGISSVYQSRLVYVTQHTRNTSSSHLDSRSISDLLHHPG